MNAGAVIAAGGLGTRMGKNQPKQLLELDGTSILERTLTPFINCPEIKEIVIVSAESIIGSIETRIRQKPFCDKPITVIQGGFERQQSVFKGIKALDATIDIVVVHDAVRPFITEKIITECCLAADMYGSVSVMRPVTETVKVVKDNVVVSTPDRSTLRVTQTPQAFSRELIESAHKRAAADNFFGTDDCMLVERLGHTVHIIEGSDMNIKITTPKDLSAAEAILKLFKKQETD